ncbi:unnamed protein product [Effrenium voratum]|nr:unnamed protein product [Effrenium voratum]
MDSDDLRPLLASFKFLKAQYRHMENEAEFFYESLRLGQETAEKQLPSALEFVGQFRKAVEAHSATLGKRPTTADISLVHLAALKASTRDEECWKSISVKQLTEICGFFWGLSKPAQDALLWSMQSGNRAVDEDAPCSVCRIPEVRMLTRSVQPGHHSHSALASASVNAFMQRMYYSISETMPTGLVPNAMNLESEAARSLLMRELMSQALEGPTTRLAKQPRDLAARELPPGNWSGLFVLYQAYCVASNERPASRTLFYQVSKEWRGALKFRPKSQHSTCQTCDKLKSEMRHAKSFMQHAVSADRLLGHLARTWKCREVYWAARQKSRAGDGLLTLICDGYDKSKPALPRWPRGRPPKGGVFERVNRTYLQISCVICHGYGCILYTAEESVSSGGSYSWECILNAIGHCWEVRDWKGLMPHIATLSNAYRPRSNADNRIPHSFVFRRKCAIKTCHSLLCWFGLELNVIKCASFGNLQPSFPYDVLENGHFVPGTDRWEAARYRGKDLWRAIMHVTPASSVMYCGRVNQLFTNQVTKESSAKKKKAAQLNLDEHQQIMDNTLLWLWLRPKLANAMDGSTMEKLDEMWLTGLLDQDLDSCCKAADPQLDWERIPFVLEAVGKHKEDYVRAAQSKTKNAHKASIAAAYNYFKAQLDADQATYEAMKLRNCKESSRKRKELLSRLQEMHTKSWALVNNYVENNLKVWMDAASYARQQEEEGYILYVRKTKDEPGDDLFDDEVKQPDSDDSDQGGDENNDESRDEDGPSEEQQLLTEFRHRFEITLRQPARMLSVKDLLITFNVASTYGRRSGFLKSLMVTARMAGGGTNIFWKSSAWRRGIVHDVQMCPRAEMYKPSQSSLTMQSAMTDTQEYKQAID